ncbi:AraC family transcriptional regulator [Amycolatopsis jiangsuensis]|uniref:AraC-like DNA-binding protein n=1 Tax=Amycolatopsis jiangsuensis TaxID=1181879 RepID=A0A840J029_9PSEU|nr:AraC family transcriptional regulator [Amycolatopsis jiangsuensis]MBB4688286.1 AraC-like DNA-binding protein [Amycolatopsis jiangsuensis]
MSVGRFTLGPAITAALADLGTPIGSVLRLAGLPEDLLLDRQAALTPDQFYRCWQAVEELSGDPAIGVALAGQARAETFQPTIFAALCSPDLRHAAERIAVYKRLLGPLQLAVDADGGSLTLTVRRLTGPEPPSSFVAYELALPVALARLGTRGRVTPARIAMPEPPRGAAAQAYREYLGTPIANGPEATVTFTALDARRPFLTANTQMWQVFEPELRRRLADLDEVESTAGRVRAALLELLPAGQCAAPAVARRLALSVRTLQRRLAREDTSFQAVLERTRHDLARHYLERPGVTVTEIALLLGYDEPSSFYRAFHQWSGTTPQQARALLGGTSSA